MKISTEEQIDLKSISDNWGQSSDMIKADSGPKISPVSASLSSDYWWSDQIYNEFVARVVLFP